MTGICKKKEAAGVNIHTIDRRNTICDYEVIRGFFTGDTIGCPLLGGLPVILHQGLASWIRLHGIAFQKGTVTFYAPGGSGPPDTNTSEFVLLLTNLIDWR